MNRIALAEESVSESALPAGSKKILGATRIASHFGTRQTGERFATFSPVHYEPGYAYPLLVWLHSWGSSERELQYIMPLVSMRNYVAAAPRGSSPCGPSANRFCWRQTQDDIEAAEASVADCVAAATQRFNVHPSRVFLAGCGAGGTMAVRIAWNDPARFAGVVAINGPLPSNSSPLRRVNELRRVPCLLATARGCHGYSSQQVCNDLRLLHSAGCTVALRQYPGSDELTNIMLSDMNRWLMELVCGPSRAES